MRWRKLRHLYYPEPVHPKLVSHAANPLAVLLAKDIYRVFYSGRDSENRSSVGYVDVDIAKQELIHVHRQPVFEHGLGHSFYSHGVSIGNLYSVGGMSYILFMGWQCPSDGHWRGEVGRLVVNRDLSLTLDGSDPFLPRDKDDPVSLSYPWVMTHADGSYRMYYGSTVTWDAGNGEMLHVIKRAWSQDGHRWQREGLAVPFVLGTAQAFSHPTVLGNHDEGYHMWFSYRGGAGTRYRIGYATSEDGDTWSLNLRGSGIDVSGSGWDSEMIEYPFVFECGGQDYMLYNGNGYGATGFGLAILER
jgi:hypothetical protein